ncbi:DUF4395 domain-containing protein [Mucilaginibacter sp. HMF5004]|uniref:DUF4395 domain-containing protein n=1 Tax=Mucilaginibacter rivuli TaxID=2857527 RepID=UPI001C5E7F8A|nr:DUF4395 domain-containing protein [Mucilaginibacter rivuli]MBW4891055.1 DUF4395 domain-containing protein [Mucilaginibacter rivuli]
MSVELECPVDLVPVNENKIRLIALLVWILAITFWFTNSKVIIIVLLADFFLRAFNLQKYSPLAFIAGIIVKQLDIKNKPTDQAPKRFAARMGFTVILLLLVFVYFDISIVVNIITLMLISFSFLESFLGVCVGCYVYTLGLNLQRLFTK